MFTKKNVELFSVSNREYGLPVVTCLPKMASISHQIKFQLFHLKNFSELIKSQQQTFFK